jgi:ribosomal protein L29
MKKLDLKDKSVEDMTKMLAEKREEIRTLRFSGMGRTKDTSTAPKLRADVARIMTELGARKKTA